MKIIKALWNVTSVMPSKIQQHAQKQIHVFNTKPVFLRNRANMPVNFLDTVLERIELEKRTQRQLSPRADVTLTTCATQAKQVRKCSKFTHPSSTSKNRNTGKIVLHNIDTKQYTYLDICVRGKTFVPNPDPVRLGYVKAMFSF